MDKNMDPCISEYGLMVVNSKPLLSTSQDNGSMDHSRGVPDYPFKADMYNFGVILLELLTGKLVQNDGLDLTTWVHSVVREEWTAEVFDKVLFAEGASEERMVNLLQVALKCINPSPEAALTYAGNARDPLHHKKPCHMLCILQSSQWWHTWTISTNQQLCLSHC
eukprot:TRINITY_DN9309_c0_g1_i11.p1 TRINITY_DN9309_c0_g1~~TRINITY_DN9309_c0_g1_i11.p1  ORF type:complete len:165 (+),score=28.50 TRINITY_DN9309_c0_g1_i11:1060-1554(+)